MSIHLEASRFATGVREQFSGDRVKNLTTGEVFTAEILPVADKELNTALGRDARESDTFYVSNRPMAAKLNIGDLVEAIGHKFRLLSRSDNPADPQVKFGAEKLNPSKDQT